MSKHTPGPWFATEDEQEIMAAREDGMECIAEALRLWESEKLVLSDEAKANARLIAAAPDLLASLVEVMDWLDRPNELTLSDEQVARIRAAIAKATGEGA